VKFSAMPESVTMLSVNLNKVALLRNARVGSLGLRGAVEACLSVL
jgi:hypothetical protein